MTLRHNILFVAAIALLSLTYVLAGNLVEQRRFYLRQNALADFASRAETLTAAIHQLQRERGLSAGWLGSPRADRLATVAVQQAASDKALGDLSPADMDRPALDSLRRQVLLAALGSDAAIEAYNSVIKGLIRRFSDGARQVADPAQRRSLEAQVHLLGAKENMGQMRAILHASLSGGGNKMPPVTKLAASLSLYDEHARIFGELAAPDTARRFQRLEKSPVMDKALGIIRLALVGNNGRGQQAIDSGRWFQTATQAVDALNGMERSLFADTIQNIRETTRRQMRRAVLHALLALAAFLAVCVLAAHAVRQMLRARDTLLDNVAHIIESEDFTLRVDEKPPEEMVAVSRGFNKLLQLVDKLMAEKDFLAASDPLTGLWNRARFQSVFTVEMQRVERYGLQCSLIIFDIDHFKRVNDDLGHHAGDLVLRAVAQLAQTNIRGIDSLGRWGGEEFVLLLPELDAVEAASTAEKLRALVSQRPLHGDTTITCSFGVAEYQKGDTLTTLVNRADDAMYQAKREGRNRVVASVLTTS